MTQISGLLRKPLNLRPSDREAVEDALSLVNGRAAAFAVTTLSGVLDAAKKATDRLDARGVRRADRVGAVATYVPAGPSARSYLSIGVES